MKRALFLIVALAFVWMILPSCNSQSDNNNSSLRYQPEDIQNHLKDAQLDKLCQALNEVKGSDDQAAIADAYVKVADRCVELNAYLEGLSFYRQALYLDDQQQLSDKTLFQIYSSCGMVYVTLKDFEAAEKYLDSASHYYEKLGVRDRYTYLDDRATFAMAKGEYRSAIAYNLSALQLFRNQPEFIREQNLVKKNLGELYVQVDRIDSAQLFQRQCYAYFDSTANASDKYDFLTQILQVSLRQGNSETANAIIYRPQYTVGVDKASLDKRKKVLEQYFLSINDFRDAYWSVKGRLVAQDSTLKALSNIRLKEIQIRYNQDTTRMQQIIASQKHYNSMKSTGQAILMWFIIIVAVVVAVVMIVLFSRSRISSLKIKHKSDIDEIRKSIASVSMSEGFVHNVQQRNQADELGLLSELLYKNTQLSDKPIVPLEEELNFVKSYIELEQKCNPNLKVQFTIDPKLSVKGKQILGRMLQIPAASAMKRALSGKNDSKEVTITLEADGISTILQILDNGGNLIIHTSGEDNSGVNLISKIIEILNSHNKEQILVSVKNTWMRNGEKGSEVKYTIPCDYSYNL